MTAVTRENISTGAMVGSVMLLNCRHAPAPSMAAASYMCLGTSSRAARKITMVLPQPHTASAVRLGLDHEGSPNQSGPAIPTHDRIWLTGPTGLSRKTKATVPATIGTSVGR